jgi:hypothetical protein
MNEATIVSSDTERFSRFFSIFPETDFILTLSNLREAHLLKDENINLAERYERIRMAPSGKFDNLALERKFQEFDDLFFHIFNDILPELLVPVIGPNHTYTGVLTTHNKSEMAEVESLVNKLEIVYRMLLHKKLAKPQRNELAYMTYSHGTIYYKNEHLDFESPFRISVMDILWSKRMTTRKTGTPYPFESLHRITSAGTLTDSFRENLKALGRYIRDAKMPLKIRIYKGTVQLQETKPEQ